jgi:hypothetical protein
MMLFRPETRSEPRCVVLGGVLGKAFKRYRGVCDLVFMDSKSKSYLAIAMGIIILLADIYWLVVGSSYTYPPWLAAGIVIFVATLVWLWVDYDLMKK